MILNTHRSKIVPAVKVNHIIILKTIMTNIFTNIDLFRTINEYTDLRSLCDTCS